MCAHIFFCSGFTSITKFSFISSNSSFSECVRRYGYRSSLHLFSYTLQSNECEQDCEGTDLATQKVILDSSSTHAFTLCSWNGGSSTLGGAICFANQTSSSLTVDNCLFYNCNSSSSGWANGGGALHCYNVSTVSIQFSSFIKCCATSGCGGGVNMCDVLHQLYLNNCTFLFCFGKDDGGSAEIWSCNLEENSLGCKDSRFISGLSTGTGDPWAGGLMLWDNNPPLQSSNIIFTNNNSTYGGAYGTNCNVDSPGYPLRFCFFHNNHGSCGNDVCFNHYISSFETKYFIHCFSSSSINRIGVVGNSNDYSEWLPLGDI